MKGGVNNLIHHINDYNIKQQWRDINTNRDIKLTMELEFFSVY
jgi:hypothetical protein